MNFDEQTNPLLASLPKRLEAKELFKKVGKKVDYTDLTTESPARRKTIINSLKSDWFYAHDVLMEIYDHLYDAVYESYRLRHPDNTIKVVNATREWMMNATKKGYAPPALNDFVPSGFSILGISGAGKTHSVSRILRSCFDQLIQRDGTTQITYLKTNCTHRGSLKEMCFMFLNEVDNLTGSTYFKQYARARYTTEELCAVVANVAARHHVGIWIIDEIHHLKSIQFKSKDQIINFLKNLNAVTGLPIVYIGTGEATDIIAGNFQQARRAQGLGSIIIKEFKEGSSEWKKLMATLWNKQVLRNPGPLTEEISDAYYRRSQGIFDAVVTLHIQVQKSALSSGCKETIDVALIDEVAEDHFKMTKPAMTALAQSKKDPTALKAFPDLSLRGLEFMDNLNEKPKLSTSEMVKVFIDNGFNENEITMCMTALANRYPDLSKLEAREKAQEIIDKSVDKSQPTKKTKPTGALLDALNEEGDGSNYDKLKNKGFAKAFNSRKTA